MARPPRDLATRSAIVPALVRYVVASGASTDAAGELVARLGLAGAAELDEVAVMPAVIVELLAAAAQLVGVPALALRLPAELPWRRYSLAELAVRASATVRDALPRLAIAAIHPHVTGELIDDTWHLRTPHHPRGISRHVHELALAYARHLTGATPTRVWFAHARPRELASIIRWAGTDDLEFGAPDSGFAIGNLDAPLATSDPRLLATVRELAPDAALVTPRTLATEVAALIRARLPEATAADDAAARLHMSARTLQRRLEGEHTSFTELLDATRERAARELLADPALPLGEIAYRLGFADLATFSRAFKRWTGKPPGLFRRT